ERNGYGVNYSGYAIKINDAVETLSVSHGVSLKTLDVKKEDSFKFVNNDKRGRLLEVGQESMVWSPSTATPVLLKASKGARGGDAYAFYALNIEGQAAETGTWLLPWTGIGLKCRDFSGTYITQAFDETTDLHAINRQCGLTDPIEEAVAYGLNWCGLPENSKSGSVYLRTIAYTPQGKTGSLTIGGASDSAKLLDLATIGTETTEYSLNGALFTTAAGKAYNQAGNIASYLNSVNDLLSLVNDGYACISTTGGSKASFWWNPVELHNLYFNIENDIAQAAGTSAPKCIIE
ncbi:hypothetical protein HZB89_00775, partial [archaeon]|nr:hypothetical protein [archaeon]